MSAKVRACARVLGEELLGRGESVLGDKKGGIREGGNARDGPFVGGLAVHEVADGVGLFGAGHEEPDLLRAGDSGKRQGDALSGRLRGVGDTDDELVFFAQLRGGGEQRVDVSVGAHAKEVEVEAAGSVLVDGVGVVRGGVVKRKVAGAVAVNIGLWDIDVVEQGVPCLPFVGVRVVDGDVAFVAEEDVDAGPCLLYTSDAADE